MPRYIAIEPIETASGRTEPGESLELSEADAAQAVALGHIRAAGKSRAAPAPAPAAPAAQQPTADPDGAAAGGSTLAADGGLAAASGGAA